MRTVQRALLAMLIFGNVLFAFSQTWEQTSATTNFWSSVISSADGTKLFACAGGGMPLTGSSSPIFVSTNGGATWMQTAAPSNHWASIACSADGTRLVAAAGTSSVLGGLYVSTDGGLSWTLKNTSPQYWRSVASSANGSNLFAITISGSLLATSTNAGTTWRSQVAPDNAWFIASSADGEKLVTASESGHVCLSTNAGQTWQTNYSLSPRIWWSCAVSADGGTMAVVDGHGGPFGHVITSTNAGATWMTNDVPLWSWQNVALSADGSKMIATGWYSSGLPTGPIYTTTNSGLTWVSNNVPSLIWQGVTLSADGNKLIAITAGTNISSLGKGRIWISQYPDSPVLSDAISSNSFELSWIIPSTNFVLQQSPDLYRWSDVTNEPIVNLTNLQNRVALPLMNSNDFFRLKTP